MTDHATQTVTLMVTLDTIELSHAARLGGLPMGLDDHLIDDPDLSLELVRHCARRGIVAAIHDSFARAYPPHYPDDIEPEFWSMRDDATARFLNIWTGAASW